MTCADCTCAITAASSVAGFVDGLRRCGTCHKRRAAGLPILDPAAGKRIGVVVNPTGHYDRNGIRVAPRVAALFVEPGGPYYDREDVDPWGLPGRDAREYAGPHAVIAHPPCKRWGRYHSGGPSHHKSGKFIKGDDGGCFAAAFEAVKRWGGVLEHPEASHAWNAFGINKPPKNGGWRRAGLWTPGWTCCVEQGHYGHEARKATWLWLVGVDDPPELVWGGAKGKRRLDEGFETRGKRAAARAAGVSPRDRLNSAERILSPPLFAELMVSLARSVAHT